MAITMQIKRELKTLTYVVRSGTPSRVFKSYQIWHQTRLRGFPIPDQYQLRFEKFLVENASKATPYKELTQLWVAYLQEKRKNEELEAKIEIESTGWKNKLAKESIKKDKLDKECTLMRSQKTD